MNKRRLVVAGSTLLLSLLGLGIMAAMLSPFSPRSGESAVGHPYSTRQEARAGQVSAVQHLLSGKMDSFDESWNRSLELSLVSVLSHLQKEPLPANARKEILQRLQAGISAATPRQLVLMQRLLSQLDLSPTETTELKKVYQDRTRGKNVSEAILRSTYGARKLSPDAEKALKRLLLSKSHSESLDGLYFLGLMKDSGARARVEQHLEKNFFNLAKTIQPHAFKHLRRQGSSPGKIEKFARSQTSDLWKEVVAASSP